MTDVSGNVSTNTETTTNNNNKTTHGGSNNLSIKDSIKNALRNEREVIAPVNKDANNEEDRIANDLDKTINKPVAENTAAPKSDTKVDKSDDKSDTKVDKSDDKSADKSDDESTKHKKALEFLQKNDEFAPEKIEETPKHVLKHKDFYESAQAKFNMNHDQVHDTLVALHGKDGLESTDINTKYASALGLLNAYGIDARALVEGQKMTHAEFQAKYQAEQRIKEIENRALNETYNHFEKNSKDYPMYKENADIIKTIVNRDIKASQMDPKGSVAKAYQMARMTDPKYLANILESYHQERLAEYKSRSNAAKGSNVKVESTPNTNFKIDANAFKTRNGFKEALSAQFKSLRK